MLLITFALAAAGVYAGRVGDDPNMDRFEGPSYMVADPTQERSVLVTIFLQCVGLWALSWAIASIVFFLLLRHPSDWTRSLAASKSGNPSQKQKRSRASPKKRSPANRSPTHRDQQRQPGKQSREDSLSNGYLPQNDQAVQNASSTFKQQVYLDRKRIWGDPKAPTQ